MSKNLSASLGPVFQIVEIETGKILRRVISHTQNITVQSEDREGNVLEKYFDRNDTQTYINDLDAERLAAKEKGYLADFEKKEARVQKANAKYNEKLASKGLERRLIGFANAVSTPKQG